MFFYILNIVIGLVGLVIGAKFLLSGSVDLGKKLNLPKNLVGLVIVALGTSLPEFMVSIQSSLQNKSDLLISNLIGSNTFNLYFILGLSAIFVPITITKKIIQFEFFISLFISLVTLVFAYQFKTLNWITSLILITTWVWFIYLNFKQDKKLITKEVEIIESDKRFLKFSNYIIPLSIVFGCACLWFSSELTLQGVVSLSQKAGLSESFIGFTILAVGTGLPELITSLVALIKKEHGLALGNVIGSNILNLSFILGISTFINPILINPINFKEILIWLCLQLVFLNLVYVFSKNRISKLEGLIMVLIYFGVLFKL